MKKTYTILLLSSLFLASTLIVFVLFISASDKPNHRFNSFERKFLTEPIHLSGELDVKYNSYYISGSTSNHLYFGNVQAVRHLLVTDSNLKDTSHIELSIDGIEEVKFRSITVKVDSPYFYFSDGTAPAIFKGFMKNWLATRYSQDRESFMDPTPINGASFIVRKMSYPSEEIVLGKKTNSPPYIQLAPDLLEKQIDGKFCTDGMIHYSNELDWLVYVYYYRNQFICADSSLNLIYRGNTIDTVSKAKIKVAKIKSENSHTMAAPPMLVNRKSCVSGIHLFINSNLLAKNEKKETFEKSSVIDVYSLKKGRYLHSFYLPKHNGKKMREFKVFDDLLIVLYDHYILKYQLDPKYISS